MSFKVELDKEACIGCGACEAQCPDIFGFDQAEGKAFIKEGQEVLKKVGCAKDAEDICPTDAIKVSGN